MPTSLVEQTMREVIFVYVAATKALNFIARTLMYIDLQTSKHRIILLATR